MKRIILACCLLCALAGPLFRLPGQAQTSPPSPFEALDPCWFNAYTERDDLMIGAVVYDWRSGAGCSQNLKTRFHFASVGKLFIAHLLYQQVIQGVYSFEDTLTFSESYWMGGRDDCLGADQLGQDFDLAYLGNIMIECSDNAATWMLMDLLGWEAVNAHAQSFGIPGFGEIIPYAEVDRLKLSYLDSRWAAVPRHLASQFYRGRAENEVSGLVPTYFERPPRYSGGEVRQANAYYVENYTYNTATPEAYALLLNRLRQDLSSPDPLLSTSAAWLFNTMLLTQRVYSTQYYPPQVYVGSKNGYDLGYRAEVNISISDLQSRLPETLSVLVVSHTDIEGANLRPYAFRNVPTTDLLLAISPRITEILYPDYQAGPAVVSTGDERLRRVVVSTQRELFPCYEAYRNYDYLDGLQECWAAIPSKDLFLASDWVGVGLVFRFLGGADLRVTLVYTEPDGRPRVYQLQEFFKDSLAMAWFEQVEEVGLWRLDVYLNLQPAYSQSFYVQ
jgi:hypothetical protein